MKNKQPEFLNLRYRCENEDYLGWKVHVYNREGCANDFEFSADKENLGYVVARVPISKYGDNVRKLWFKIHKDNWNKVDGKTNRSIKISDFKEAKDIDVYIRKNERVKYFTKPKLKHTKVNLYYHRHENDYAGWDCSWFVEKVNNNQRNIKFSESAEFDGTFKKVSFNIDYMPDEKEFDFYLRNKDIADLVDFRRVKLKEGRMDIYVVQDEKKVFLSKEDAIKHMQPKIIKAVFGNQHNQNYNTIYVELNTSISEEMLKVYSSFKIYSKCGDEKSVKEVTYTDESKRRLKIVLDDSYINPFEKKYSLKILPFSKNKNIAFTKSANISINRLYDTKEFQKKFEQPNIESQKEFGLICKNGEYSFSVWTPTADNVRLLVYDNPIGGEPISEYPMTNKNGSWEVDLKGQLSKELEGKYYTYQIFQNNKKYEVFDPYAKTSGIGAKRSAIIEISKTNPEGWDNHKRPQGKLETPVVYEMSIRDFTSGVGSTVEKDKQGKFIGVIDKINHLKKLGINTVQLLPVTKFDSNEFAKNGGKYNWGYDQKGYWFLPEGSYCTNPQDPVLRVKEFKEMVKALHENGIRVVIDAVHNHTYETESSVLNKLVPGYYYRQHWDDSFSNGSGCGNETKSERAMVGKLICDYMKYWVKEMGVDGFRIDLMSLTDKYTMQKVRQEIDKINPDVAIYGEAYTMGWSILPRELQSSKENMNCPELKGIGAFTDIGSRNAIRGHNDAAGLATGAHPSDWNSEIFYIGQKGEFIDITARNNSTEKVMNYVDVHDDLLTIDMLKQYNRNYTKQEQLKRYKLAYTMLFNYIGPVVIKSGAEGVTTKHGDYNSYRTEEVNLLNWNRMKKFKDMKKYFSEYIKFRKSHPAYFMNRNDVNTKFEVLDSHEGFIKGKMFKNNANNDPFNKLLVYHNISKKELIVDLPYEMSGWAIVGNEKTIGNKRIGEVVKGKVKIPPLSTIVLGDNYSVEKTMNKELNYTLGKII